MNRNQKIAVAMSGGVDSSVSAALLVQAGYDVIGIMLNLWKDECSERENSCCTTEAINQARSTAYDLEIPFYVIDAKEEFKKKVVNYFISSYKNGETPNPCFVCNQVIKWGLLLQKAQEFGAEKIATGHYARIEKDNFGFYHLYRGVDRQKDQSYILAGLTQEQLNATVFPLGNLNKSEVRIIAQKINLNSASKPDSQDLCFVGNQDYRIFLSHYLSNNEKSGNIRLISGEVVGEHLGLSKYTIGQRKGLGSGFSSPVYVIRKDILNNEIIIGMAEDLGVKKFMATRTNWINKSKINPCFECFVKIRYKSNEIKCRVELIENDHITVFLESKVRDATPGQIAVFYDDNEVLGSGIIVSTEGE